MSETPSRTFNWKEIPFFLFAAAVLFLGLSPSVSLMLGLVVGLFFIQPRPKTVKKITKYLLQLSIVGIGFGMNLQKVLSAGSDGFVFTLLSLAAAMGLGFLLGRWLKIDQKISYLVSVGTAICGGSAIAAVSQVLKADERDISVSIGIVFILNAVALFIFPPIGHYFGLDENSFGIWAAIAIHDTSSVVGASAQYGDTALMTATTIKLARALWIIPMTLLTALIFRTKSSASEFPWFILLFLIASAVSTYAPIPESLSFGVVKMAKLGFSATLFLIGSGLSKSAIRHVGVKPLVHGVVLWVVILTTSLFLLAR